jgi:hypothetical protein
VAADAVSKNALVEVRDQSCRGELKARSEADVAAQLGPNCVPYYFPDGLPADEAGRARSWKRYWIAANNVQAQDSLEPRLQRGRSALQRVPGDTPQSVSTPVHKPLVRLC